jgi:endonuclease-3
VTAKRATGSSAKSLPARVDEILARLRLSNPDPRCELYYETPFQLLVSVVLSAQATDKSVNEAMRPLYEKDLTPSDILSMGELGFLEKIRRIGLAPTKSKNVLKLSKIIHEQYADEIPRTREELEALPGVGRKTANVILGEIFREPTIAVDTHVFRVTARLGLHKESTPEKAEHKLLSMIDKKWLPMAHHWFILHGRYTCLARNPKCTSCVLADLCKVKSK